MKFAFLMASHCHDINKLESILKINVFNSKNIYLCQTKPTQVCYFLKWIIQIYDSLYILACFQRGFPAHK